MDSTDRTYSAASEMRADGCALAYETFAVVFLVVIPEGNLLFSYSMDGTSTERLSVPKLRQCAPQDHISALLYSRPPTRSRQRLTGQNLSSVICLSRSSHRCDFEKAILPLGILPARPAGKTTL